MSRETLVVIGAGPKAMALAAKAAVLAELGFEVPAVAVVEQKEIGANWTGSAGYTNGRQPLGTSPEKDLGFPYESSCWGDAAAQVNARMLRFSWQAFQIDRGCYGDWVDRGKPAPLHEDWAAYLRWVAAGLGDHLRVHLGAVAGVGIEGGRWVVRYGEGGAGGEVRGEGLVVTGPGRVNRPGDLPDHPRVLTVETYWLVADELASLREARVAVVGTGETAAAVVIDLAEGIGRGLELDIYSPVGMAYSRGESYRENRVYTDPEQGNWSRLTPQHRRDFIRRTDRGVFSQEANRMLDRAANLEILPGRLVGAEVEGDREVRARFEYHGEAREERYDYLILATGADHVALLDSKLDPDARAGILAAAGVGEISMAAFEERVDVDLGLRGLEPRLHLPMLAGLGQGPGFANLSSLGRLSDRILESYALPGEEAP